MIPVLPILLMAVVLAAGQGFAVAPASPLVSIAAAVVPVLLILFGVWALTADVLRRIRARTGSAAGLAANERLVAAAQWLIVLVHVIAVMGYGVLETIRRGLGGDTILLDELLALAPPLLGLLGIWAIRYPVERFLREATMFRRLDRGQTFYPMPPRRTWVFNQFRLHVAMIIVPLVVVVTCHEVVEQLVAPHLVPDDRPWVLEVVQFAVGLTVVMLAPLLVRRVLTVTPLRSGDVYDDLQAICRRHRVRVREHLILRTDGSMINAAVMGVLAPLRFVMLTDELLEVLPRRQVRAVMAHEIGHVRDRHLPWLVIVLLGLALGATALVEPLRIAIILSGAIETAHDLVWLDAGTMVVILAVVLIGFGWTSRRFERQADTFAVRHLSEAEPLPDDVAPACGGPKIVRPDAVAAMNGALDAVSAHNAVPTSKRNWRHGSVAWRQRYLRSLVGRTLGRLPIDRTVRAVKLAALVMILAAPFALVALNDYLIEALDHQAGVPRDAVPVSSLDAGAPAS